MQQQKNSGSRRLLNIEEVAKELDVKKFLIKFWEKEFKLNLERTHNNNRCYSQENLQSLIAIKDLIHNKKMSLSQAKKQINPSNSFLAASVPESQETQVTSSQNSESISVQPATTSTEKTNDSELFRQNLRIFREQLINLKQLLDLD